MAINVELYKSLTDKLNGLNVELVAVSKIQSIQDVQKLYDMGHRDFGENYVQEVVEKQAQLPADTRWHFIGHLQSNKVKYIVPFVHLLQGVDSLKLLKEINKQAKKLNKVVNCLLQVHIAQEETKFGLAESELEEIMTLLQEKPNVLANVHVNGLMGMASFSDDNEKVRREMQRLKSLFDKYSPVASTNCNMKTLSMGMSGDYEMAIEEGSNMVRIGSLLFGARVYNK